MIKAECGMDYVRAAFKRDFADRVPVTVSMGSFQANLAGVPLRKFLTDRKTLVEATLKSYDAVRPDTMMAAIDLNLEAEAMGNVVEFPDYGQPLARKRVLSEDISALSKLKVPDPEKDGRGPMYLEACRDLAEHFGRQLSVASVVNGPWNIGVTLRGTEKLIMDTYDNPDFVHDLMRLTTEVCKAYTLKLKDTGTGVTITEAASSCSLISPTLYREFIKPYHAELFDLFKERRLNVSLHICGYVDPILKDLLDLPVAAYSIDSPTSMNQFRELAGTKTVVIGNVATSLFAEGTPAQIEAATKEVIDICAKGSAFMLSSGCEIPYNSTLDRVLHFVKFGREYGKYAQ